MHIGFIGLGNMGAPMVANLIAEGYHVTGYDIAGVAIEGMHEAATARDAATGRDVVITMLPDGAILRGVAAEILPVMAADTLFIDCSTVDVASARAVASDAASAGIVAVDAPVSGGIAGAAAGTLTFMAGGSDAGFNRAMPLFEVMGKKAVHCGGNGAGQSAKICNNLILAVNMIGTCEAFALADRLGLDREKMHGVVSTSTGYSWVMNDYTPAPGIGATSPADNDYKPGFAAELMLKDLGLALAAAEDTDADTPMGRMAAELYRLFVEEEGGRGMDFSAMIKRFERQ